MRRFTGLSSGSWLTSVSAVVSRMIPTSFRSPRPDGDFSRQLFPNAENGNGKLKLECGSHIGVIGSGPAGSFFSHFLLDMTQRLGIDVGLAPWTRAPALAGGSHSGFHPTGVPLGSTSIMIATTLRLTDQPAATCAVASFQSYWFSSGLVL